MEPVELQMLLNRVDTWRGQARLGKQRVLSTRCDALDQAVGGLPVGALTEILSDRLGLGELSLLLPALREAMADERWLVMIGVPQTPYGPALERAGIALRRTLVISATERRKAQGTDEWAAEQCLRSGACGAVLLWADELESQVPRRLQLAAEQGMACGVLFRPVCRVRQASTAALRLGLTPGAGLGSGVRPPGNRRLSVQIHKQRGRLVTPQVECELKSL